MKYPLNPLNAINTGAQIDLRLQLAMGLMASPNFCNDMLECFEYEAAQAAQAGSNGSPAAPDPAAHRRAAAHHVALTAMTLAKVVVELAEQEGWIQPLPTEEDISDELATHVKQQAGAQVLSQLHGQELMRQAQPSVIPGVMPGRVN
jgi:hypothetical protein